jgi:hypothetical protein
MGFDLFKAQLKILVNSGEQDEDNEEDETPIVITLTLLAGGVVTPRKDCKQRRLRSTISDPEKQNQTGGENFSQATGLHDASQPNRRFAT